MDKVQLTLRERLRAARPGSQTILLPVDRAKPSQLLVSVNGVRYSIQRGKPVEVPWVVAQVIEQSARSDAQVQQRIAKLADTPWVTVI